MIRSSSFHTYRFFDTLRQEGLLSDHGHLKLNEHLDGLAQSVSEVERSPTEWDWDTVRRMFSFPEDRVPMNAANLCPGFTRVVEAINTFRLDYNQDVSIQRRKAVFHLLIEHARAAIASMLRVRPADLALVRNATEANNNLNNGRNWGSVLLWDENHPTNNQAWDLRKERYSFEVRRLRLVGAHSPEEILQRFEEELKKKPAGMVTFTEVSNVSGMKLPARQLCALAHKYKAHVHVDGAQSWGALDVDLASMGCDSYAASAHKWFMGPAETGVLFIKEEAAQSILPNTFGYDTYINLPGQLPRDARRFELLGQRDDANLCALLITADLHAAIGPSRIERRVADLAEELKQGMLRIGEELITPRSAALSHGVVVIKVAPDGRESLYNYLYKKHGLAVAPAAAGVRFCPHIYNTRSHLERAIRGVKEWREQSHQA